MDLSLCGESPCIRFICFSTAEALYFLHGKDDTSTMSKKLFENSQINRNWAIFSLALSAAALGAAIMLYFGAF